MSRLRVLFTAGPGLSIPAAGTVNVEDNLPPVAVYALAAVVEAAGFECTIVDPVRFWRDLETEEAVMRVAEGHQVICISANVVTWPLAIPLIRAFARCDPRPTIILGGVHPTYCTEHVLERTEADIVVRGEGERTLRLLLEALDRREPLEQIPGLTLRGPDGPVSTPNAAPLTIEELDAVPPPLWEQLPPEVYSFIPVEASRGCLFGCSFCSILHKHNWRPLSDEVLRERIRQAVRVLPLVRLRALMFGDDCFTTDAARVRRIAGLIESEASGIGTALEGRASDVIRPDVLDGLRRMNVEFLQIGVECGYPEGLRRVRKGVTIDKVQASTEALYRIGLVEEAKYSYIVGFPWEGWAEMARTISFGVSLASRYGNRCQVAWLMVAPGSEIYNQQEREGRVRASDFDDPTVEHWDVFVRTHPRVDALQAQRLREFALLQRQIYPWVGALGGMFDPLTRYYRLPEDTPRPFAQAGGEWTEGAFWRQLPEVLRPGA